MSSHLDMLSDNPISAIITIIIIIIIIFLSVATVRS